MPTARDKARGSSRRRFVHPLGGADPLTLARVLLASGPVPPGSLPRLAVVAAASLLRAPSSLLEWGAVELARRRTPAGPPPIFIVGHWRSGTTHLYNVMSKDPGLAFVPPVATGMPWDFLGLGRVLRPLLDRALPAKRFIDRIPVKPDSPQEDEIALANMQPLSFYHGLYFPRRLREWFMKGVFFEDCSDVEIERWVRRARHFHTKLTLLQPGRRLLLKNPVYSARVAHLARIYPEARFIHIHRDPIQVFESMRNFYRVLLGEFALQPFDGIDIDGFILETYPRLMQALLEQTRQLPDGQLVEVRFEELQQQPIQELERVYTALGIAGFAAARPHFERYLGSVRGYRKNEYEFPPERVERVRRHWGPLIDRLGYAPRVV